MKKPVLLLWIIASACATILAVTPPQITLTTPNGGENLLLGTGYTITWNCSNCAGNINVIVKIYNTLHSEPGYQGQISPAGVQMSQGFFRWLEMGKLNDGTFIKPGPGYKIRLEAVDSSDVSDGTFSIVKKQN